MSLYNDLRPTTFKEVVGQDSAVKTLQALLKNGFPHTVLFSGPSGVGKTTLARIVAKRLGCNSEMDFHEINCAAEEKVMDMVRNMIDQSRLSPNQGSDCRVWLLDEFQSMSRATFSQQGLLKLLEEPPRTAYFMIATTDPSKIIETIRNRCTQIALKAIEPNDISKLLGRTEVQLLPEVIARIIDLSEGSARQALVLAEKVMNLPESDQLEALQDPEVKKVAIDICRALMANKPWTEVARIVQAVEQDPEEVRRSVLGYACKTLLGGGKMAGRAAGILDAFRDDYFQCGKPGLVLSCYNICTKK